MSRRTSILRGTAIALSAIGAMAWATAGQAQQVGTYNGFSADGNAISITVGTDSSNGDFEVTGASVNFTANCEATEGTISTGWGFGQSTDIIGGRAPLLLNFEYAYISSPQMIFHGTTTITGRISSRTAVFVPGTTPPTKAMYCISPSQTFSATFASPDRAPGVPAGAAAINYGTIRTPTGSR